jgi:hypothetical protein
MLLAHRIICTEFDIKTCKMRTDEIENLAISKRELGCFSYEPGLLAVCDDNSIVFTPAQLTRSIVIN